MSILAPCALRAGPAGFRAGRFVPKARKFPRKKGFLMQRSAEAAPQEPAAAPMFKPSLVGLTRAGLAESLRAIGAPASPR